MILVFHHCGQFIISNMEFLFSWVTNLYICIAQLENIPIKSSLQWQCKPFRIKTMPARSTSPTSLSSDWRHRGSSSLYSEMCLLICRRRGSVSEKIWNMYNAAGLFMKSLTFRQIWNSCHSDPFIQNQILHSVQRSNLGCGGDGGPSLPG